MRVHPLASAVVVNVCAVVCSVACTVVCAGCGNDCVAHREATVHAASDVGVIVDRVENRFRPAMVSITFDDAGIGEDLAAADLEDRGMRGTFYFTSRFIDSDDIHMTRSQAERIVEGGHEIGDHTVTHPNLRHVPAFWLANEIVGARNELDPLVCVADIKSFAPPFGATNDDVTDVVKANGFTSQRTVIRGYNLPDTDVFQLKSNAVNSSVGNWIEETPATMHAAMRDAIDAGGWFIMHFHMIVEDTPKLHVEYPRAQMDAIFDDVKDARDDGDVQVVTIAQGLAVLRAR